MATATPQDSYKATETEIRATTIAEAAKRHHLVALLPLAGTAELSDFFSHDEALTLLPLLQIANEQALRLLPGAHPRKPVYELRTAPGVFYLPAALSPETCKTELQRCATEYMYEPGASTNTSPQPIAPDSHPLTSLFSPYRGSTRLRWVSLGCQYDWTSRNYTSRGQLPTSLADMATEIAEYVRKVDNSDRTAHWERYAPDCALVNYYSRGDRLRGHVDDVEEALEMPLITFSFGQPAIFLMGGPSRSVNPIPIILREGDCLILSGESRLSYHGVPKLLKWQPGPSQKALEDFAAAMRVNISVRQCWRPTQKSP